MDKRMRVWRADISHASQAPDDTFERGKSFIKSRIAFG